VFVQALRRLDARIENGELRIETRIEKRGCFDSRFSILDSGFWVQAHRAQPWGLNELGERRGM
jgi:hypothetical protein